MKIFLSWSGQTSRAFAHKMQEFFGQVLPWAEIYLSDDEIESGERWLTNINAALEDSSYGVIFVTNENKVAPWVLFEAGALSKRIAESRVVPLLCDVDDIDLTGNPLSQFQYRKVNRQDIERLVKDMNSKGDVTVPWDRLINTFNKFWPDYEPQITCLQEESAKRQKEAAAGSGKAKQTSKVDVEQLHDSLNEILRAVRAYPRVPNALSASYNPNSVGGSSEAFLPENVLQIEFGHDKYYGEFDPVVDRARLVRKADGKAVMRYARHPGHTPTSWRSRFIRTAARLEAENGEDAG